MSKALGKPQWTLSFKVKMNMFCTLCLVHVKNCLFSYFDIYTNTKIWKYLLFIIYLCLFVHSIRKMSNFFLTNATSTVNWVICMSQELIIQPVCIHSTMLILNYKHVLTIDNCHYYIHLTKFKLKIFESSHHAFYSETNAVWLKFFSGKWVMFYLNVAVNSLD